MDQHALCEPVPFTETSHLTCTFVLQVCLLTSARLRFGAFVPSLSKMVLKDLVVRCPTDRPRQAALPLKAPPTVCGCPQLCLNSLKAVLRAARPSASRERGGLSE